MWKEFEDKFLNVLIIYSPLGKMSDNKDLLESNNVHFQK